MLVAVRLLEVPPKPLVEHRRTTLTTGTRGHFLYLELVDFSHFIRDEVYSPATGVADDKLPPGLQERRAEILEGVERCCFLGMVNTIAASTGARGAPVLI